MDSQASLDIKVKPSKSATSRIAFLTLPTTEIELARQDNLASMSSRGYNTFVWPLLQHGRLTADFPKKKAAYSNDLTGLLISAMGRRMESNDASHWILVDPLSATHPNSKELSSFAAKHREWLMRNPQSRRTPIGERGNASLFSWVNPNFRRYLGEILVALAETQTFQSIVIDLRAYPIRSNDPTRWYCCSYESQTRASEELGIQFDQLIANGTRSDIHRWQRWVYQELTTLIRYLKSRVRVARYDIFWKVLVSYDNPHDKEQSPWVDWVRSGLMEEVLVQFDPEEVSPTTMIQQIDVASGRKGLIVPVYEDEANVQTNWEQLATACTTGYAVLDPNFKPGPSLPEFTSVWEYNGALEDNPHETAVGLSKFLSSIFDEDSSEHRFYKRLTKVLENFEPEPESVSRLLGHAVKMEKRLESIRYKLSKDQKKFEREMELLLRILPTIRMIPEVY